MSQNTLKRAAENEDHAEKVETEPKVMKIQKFPWKCLNLILQHLTAKDLLKLSIVSRDINKKVGTSQNFKDKVQLALVDIAGLSKKQSRKDFNVTMARSNRIYGNLRIRAEKIDMEEVNTLWKHNWQSASFNISTFDSSMKFVKYLGLVTPTLTSLSLSVQSIKLFSSYCKLDFPCLVELNFPQCISTVLEAFVKEGKNRLLRKLVISAVKQSGDRNSTNVSLIYREFLKKFEGLTCLDITSSYTAKAFFDRDISKIASCRLKIFRVDAPAGTEACKNVERFIMSQGNSLIEICLLTWKDIETIYKIWESMKVVKHLQIQNKKDVIDFQDTSKIKNYKIPVKDSLGHLVILFPKSVISQEFIKPLVDAAGKNLRVLRIEGEVFGETYEELTGKADKVTLNNLVVSERLPAEASVEYLNTSTDSGDQYSSETDEESSISSIENLSQPDEEMEISYNIEVLE